MNRYHVFELSSDCRCSDIGPEPGFSTGAEAWAFAYSRATARWTNRNYYLIVSGGEIIGVHPGLGLLSEISGDAEPYGANLSRPAMHIEPKS